MSPILGMGAAIASETGRVLYERQQKALGCAADHATVLGHRLTTTEVAEIVDAYLKSMSHQEAKASI